VVSNPTPGDEDVRWFSFDERCHVPKPQMPCHLTRTTAATHQLIRDNLHETPTYGGWVGAKVRSGFLCRTRTHTQS
jgi:tRNA uridine 5-carboxymethylaminomethyl modification enzyme